MTKEIVLLVNRVLNYLERTLGLIEKMYTQYKRHKREKAIEKILDDPDGAWVDRFGDRVSDDEDAPNAPQ